MDIRHDEIRFGPTRPAAHPAIANDAAPLPDDHPRDHPRAGSNAIPLAGTRKLAGSDPIPPRRRPLDSGEVFRFWAFR